MKGRPVIAMNGKGEEVKKLQAMLEALGYSVREEDGFFGPQTGNAVISFQSQHGLVADGVVGERT